MPTRERVDDKQGEEHIVREQHKLILPPGSIYSDEEVRVLGPWQRVRQRFLGPIAVVLARLKLSADMLSLLILYILALPLVFLSFWRLRKAL
jgi:hypothetical protein